MTTVNKPLAFLLIITAIAAACTKIDTTRIGSDLVPVVDNINTFDTFLDVISLNDIPTDSTRIFASDAHMVGGISDDPQFGASSAAMFFEMKPSAFPYAFANKDSIINLDSAVLVLSYLGYYGDSSIPANFRLFEVDRQMLPDTSVYPMYNLTPALQINRSKFWGEKTIAANQFKDTIPLYRGDSLQGKVINQLRIPLNYTLAKALFNSDSTTGPFKSDSLFKIGLPGFALEVSGTPNTLFYFAVNGTTSRLEFFYRAKNGGIDTTSKSFAFTASSGHAVAFNRNRSGAEINNFLNPNPSVGASQVYIQTTPGTSAIIKVPGLANLSNRVIHRAELRITELTPNNSGIYSQLIPPPVLYLDIADTSKTYKGIPYDMAPLTNYFCFPASGIEYGYFGGASKKENVNNQILYQYRMNITRYLQAIITRKEKAHDFRLSAPYYVVYPNCYASSLYYPGDFFRITTSSGSIANTPGFGRIRLAGGSHPDLNLRMRVRVIYSKI